MHAHNMTLLVQDDNIMHTSSRKSEVQVDEISFSLPSCCVTVVDRNILHRDSTSNLLEEHGHLWEHGQIPHSVTKAKLRPRAY